MNSKLKQSTREHLESFSLNEEQLNQLESLGRKAGNKASGRRAIPYWPIAAAAAAFLLVFLLTPLITGHKDIQHRIALEVAANHIKLKPLEIETSSISVAREYFDKLDFVPVNSVLVNSLGLELIGGRYCSLQGVAAAQLRLKQPGSDAVQTLYQTDYQQEVFEDIPVLEQGEQPVERYAKGIRVRIWAEKGLLFALTESPQ